MAWVGAGGMGEVYRARDVRLGRDVAVKVLPASLAADAERMRRFEQEARAAAALNHPNLLAVYDVGTFSAAATGDAEATAAAPAASPFIVSELLHGGTIRERLEGGPLPQRKAVDYAIQIARGLAAAHAGNIVHRDLKPENIFVTADGRVKVLDFGLAKLIEPAAQSSENAATLEARTAAGMVLGTVGYMAPEQVRAHNADHRADIFAFGTILYEMLTGRRAFQGATPADTMSAILREDPPEMAATNRAIAPALERIVRHCLEKEPQQRFQSADDIAFHLEELSGGSSTARAAAVPERGYWNRRRALFAAVGIAGLIAAAVVGFVAGGGTGRTLARRFRPITYRQGDVSAARYTADGRSVVYTAAWDEKGVELYITDVAKAAPRSLGVKSARLLAVSDAGELLLLTNLKLLYGHAAVGVLARFPMSGGTPRGLMENIGSADLGRDGQMAVARYVPDRTGFQLEYPVGHVLFQTPGYVSDVRVSPDGKLVAFMQHDIFGDDRGVVSVVDQQGKKKVLTQEFDGEEGLAWEPSGKRIWFTGDDGLHVVDLNGKDRLEIQAPGRLYVDDVSPNGTVLLHHETARIGLTVVGPGNPPVRDLSWWDYAFPNGISADGSIVLFSEQGRAAGKGYVAFARKSDGSPAVQLGPGIPLAISPDNKYVLTEPVERPGQFFLAPLEVGDVRRLTNDSIDRGSVADFMPDGKRIVFDGVEPGRALRVYVQDLNGGPAKAVTPEGYGTPLVAPDGDTLAVRQVGSGKTVLWSLSAGAERPLQGWHNADRVLDWSRDGQLFVITDEPRGTRFGWTGEVFKLNPATGERKLWKRVDLPPISGTLYLFPRISRDGSTLAFQYDLAFGGVYEIEGLK